MRKWVEVYIPALCMGFTFIICGICLSELFAGNESREFALWILEFLGFLALTMIVDMLISNIDFKTYTGHLLAEMAACYPLLLLACYLGHWIGFRFYPILLVSLIYVICMGLIHLYYYEMSKRQAEELNEMLRNGGKDGKSN
ncbi:hypothetical protein lbkm_0459 [Lachnospiraceae bacterium KM106-2]|nr:hypothetical protein lbkm_0459 [Lachnospiraceae bacterium KM106-2]